MKHEKGEGAWNEGDERVLSQDRGHWVWLMHAQIMLYVYGQCLCLVTTFSSTSVTVSFFVATMEHLRGLNLSNFYHWNFLNFELSLNADYFRPFKFRFCFALFVFLIRFWYKESEKVKERRRKVDQKFFLNVFFIIYIWLHYHYKKLSYLFVNSRTSAGRTFGSGCF